MKHMSNKLTREKVTHIVFIGQGPPYWHLGGSSIFCDSIIHKIGGKNKTVYATNDIKNKHVKKYTKENNLKAISLHLLKIRTNVAIGIPSLKYITEVLRTVLKEECIIYMFEINSPAGALHLILKYLCKALNLKLRIILFPMGMVASRKNQRRDKDLVLGMIKGVLQRISINSSDVVHCQSINELARVTEMVGKSKSKARLMPLSSRASMEYLDSKIKHEEKQSQIKEINTNRWLSLCRVTPEKGLENSMKILSNLGLNEPTFVAYGKVIDREYENFLQELAIQLGIKLIRETEFDSELRFEIYNSFQVMALLPTVHEDSSLATIEMILAEESDCESKLSTT